MTRPPSPPDPFSGIAAAATALHELYRSYMEAGFTDRQALYLVGKQIEAMTRNAGSDE